LKTNVFILEKFLDTAFRGPIRFRQKVLMVFFWTPLELFSLEREGRPVAGRPFRLFLSLCSTPSADLFYSSVTCACRSGLAAWSGSPLIPVAKLRFAPNR